MSGDKILQDCETFSEIGFNWGLDNFTGGLGHQTAHSSKLAYLLGAASCAGVGHHVNGVEALYFFLGAILESHGH